MKNKLVIFALALICIMDNINADVLSTAIKLLSIYDQCYMKADELRGGLFVDFITEVEKHKLREIISNIRIKHAILLNQRQPKPIKPEDYYIQLLRPVRPAYPRDSLIYGEYTAGIHTEITYLGNHYKIFNEQVTNPKLEEDLKEDLKKILSILNSNSEFINICCKYDLSQDIQELMKELSELMK